MAILLALTPATLLADDVYLRGGGQITGQIVERTEDTLTVDFGAGRMTVPLSSVERVDEGLSPLGEYRERAEQLAPGDTEGWRQLAEWAADRSLATQSRQAYSQVLAGAPDDAEANRALGRVQYQGRWVAAEESYRAQGYVEFEGEWVKPAERQQILAERGAAAAADQQALDRELAEREQELRAEKDARTASDEAFWAGSQIPAGGVVHWGWGTGPTVWPYPQQLGSTP